MSGRGEDFPKIESLGGGVRNFLLERGDKPEKGGGGGGRGVDVEMRGSPLFLLLYSSITFTLCGGKVRFPLVLFGSSVLS